MKKMRIQKMMKRMKKEDKNKSNYKKNRMGNSSSKKIK